MRTPFTPRGLASMRAWVSFVSVGLVLTLAAASCGPTGRTLVTAPTPTATAVPTATPVPGTWRVTQDGDDLRIAFGVSPSFPQYGSIDRRSGFLRLVYGPDSQFGTSALLVPALWVQSSTLCPPGGYCQGTGVTIEPVTIEPHEQFPDLTIHLEGVTAGLTVKTDVRLSRPAMNAISAHVTTTVTGSTQLLPRPGETFKLVTLASMHVSATQWDAKRAYTKKPINSFELPDAPTDNEYIGDSANPVSAQTFGLEGGTSSTKMNAPTIEVTFDKVPPCTILGYDTKSSDPQDDNVAFWCASESIQTSWSYVISAFAAAP